MRHAVERLLFNLLAMVTEFESDLIRGRTIHGVPDHRGDATQATRTAAAIRTSRILTGAMRMLLREGLTGGRSWPGVLDHVTAAVSQFRS